MLRRIPKIQIVINLPVEVIRDIDANIAKGLWESRSGAVRLMVSEYLGQTSVVAKLPVERIQELDNLIKTGRWDSRPNAIRAIVEEYLGKLRTITR